MTWGEIGGVREGKSEETGRHKRHEARNSSHSISLVVITLVTTHVKRNKNCSTTGLLLWLHVSNGRRGYCSMLPPLSPFELWVIMNKKHKEPA